MTTLRTYCTSGVFILILFVEVQEGSGFLDGWKDAMKDAGEVYGHVRDTIKSFADGVDFIDGFIDDAIEEKCKYSCPQGTVPKKNKQHVPRSNGCGSLGVTLEETSLPMPELRKCCDRHDICYDTCGEEKERCDSKFKKCLYSVCDANKDINAQTNKNFQETVDMVPGARTLLKIFEPEYHCRLGAKMMYTATTAVGCRSYKEAQSAACICSPTRNDRDL